MKNVFLLILICNFFGINETQASWFSSSPKISEKKDDLGHIFRDDHGHFNEDNPENRAFIEAATESTYYKVTTNNYGNDIYLRTMPNGMQAWAEVRDGFIRNGGRNSFPKQWVPDNSKKGGHFITPKFTLYNAKDPTFRGALTINKLVNRNGFTNKLSPSHWGTRQVKTVQGVEGQYGKIVNLLDNSQKKGSHQIFLPLDTITEEEALQVLREIAQGIYVYDAVPIFSLHFNRSKDQYPILFPHYRKTLTGEAIAMLDFWMKSAVNGRYFDSDFIYSWEENRNSSNTYLLKKSHSFHEYCNKLGIPYRSFFDIVGELRERSNIKVVDRQKLRASFRIVDFQNHIWKLDDSISFEPDIKIEYSLNLNEEQSPELDMIKAVCDEMCSELSRVLPQIPQMKRYFEILHLANFFSYYCQTMKEEGLIPLLDRDLKKSQIEYQGCPNLFPPIPISMKDVVEIKLVDFLNYLEATSSFQLNQLIEDESRQGEKEFYLGMQSYLEGSNQNLQHFTTAVFEHCRARFSKMKSDFELFFQGLGIYENPDHPQTRRSFFNRIDHLIQELEGEEKKEMQMLKKRVSEWFENPCLFVFKNSGMKLNTENGNFFPINHCDSDDVQFAGGCGFPIHHDMVAEENPDLIEMNMRTIQIPYSKMEIEEWDDPKEVAKGYLFPPLPGYPMKDSIFALLNAIQEEDIGLFDQRKTELWMWEWNFCDPLGRFFIHHAARAKTAHFLSHMISKWTTIDQKDSQGWTPLHYAAAYGSVECTHSLLSYQPSLLEKTGDDGETAFFVAAQHGKQEVLTTLLNFGANPNCKIHLGLNPLMWSILSEQDDIAEQLMSCPSIDLSYQSAEGETVLELAIQAKSIRVLRKLLDFNIDVNRYHKGMTPLQLATALGWQEGVNLLLNHPLVEAETECVMR